MVENASSRKPLNANSFGDIWERCKDNGVLLGKGGLNGNVSWKLDTFTKCRREHRRSYGIETIRVVTFDVSKF